MNIIRSIKLAVRNTLDDLSMRRKYRRIERVIAECRSVDDLPEGLRKELNRFADQIGVIRDIQVDLNQLLRFFEIPRDCHGAKYIRRLVMTYPVTDTERSLRRQLENPFIRRKIMMSVLTSFGDLTERRRQFFTADAERNNMLVTWINGEW